MKKGIIGRPRNITRVMHVGDFLNTEHQQTITQPKKVHSTFELFYNSNLKEKC